MDFRILGPVEVVDGGRVVPLGPPKQRALLALLLLHVNEVVPRDRVIDELWGERAPQTAATALHGYVSQLRKLLEPSNGPERRLLITRAPGYLLELNPGQIDLKRFERLAHRGRRELAAGEAEPAAATLAEALALWRGPPLQEFSSTPFALAESLRLQDLMVSTLEDRIDADLALRRHDDLVPELEALVAEHPFRERLHAQLMLALYRGGRQAEALDVYRKTRRRLVEELGIEAGPELQELQQAILRHDQAIAPKAVAPRANGRQERRRLAGVGRLVALGLSLVAVVAALAFVLGGREERSIDLAPNSVGFIDAKSGRVTRSFQVGREPRGLTVADKAVWVANYRDGTVTRVDEVDGGLTTIPVGGHPTGLTAYQGTIWVWTLEGLLVPVDPRYKRAGHSISFVHEIVAARSAGGGITAGGGFLWITAPPVTVIRVDAANPRNRRPLVPDPGVQGAIGYRDGKAWVAGADQVFPITPRTGVTGLGAKVGAVRNFAFGAGSLWVVSGGQGHMGGVVQALRRVDPHTRLVQATITVGSDPVAVAAAGGSIWVAARTDGTIERVNPVENQVVETILLGAKPSALVAADDGVWVAVG